MGTLTPHNRLGGGPGPPPLPAVLVRNRTDLHNLSQDSGLSYSPVFQLESPQLTIGSPIRCVGDPSAISKTGAVTSGSRRDKRRWSISGLFKRRRSDEPRKQQALSPQQHSSSESEMTHVGGGSGVPPPPLPPRRCARTSPAPGIFPHLRPDRLYPPEEATAQLASGYYYHPRYGYVRTGSYYDQQINCLSSRSQQQQQQDGLSSRSSGVDSDLNSSLDLRYQPDGSTSFDEEEEEQVTRGRSPRAHSLSRLQAAAATDRQPGGLAMQGRCGSCDSIARGRQNQQLICERQGLVYQTAAGRMRDGRGFLESNSHKKQHNDSGHHHPEPWHQVQQPVRSAQETGPYVQEQWRSFQEPGHSNHEPWRSVQEPGRLVPELWRPAHRLSPYVHVATPPPPAHSQSLRAEAASVYAAPLSSPNTPALPPPPPPPRDPRRRLFFISGANGRPVSYSFEHIGTPPPAEQANLNTWAGGSVGGGHGSRTDPPIPVIRPYAYGDPHATRALDHRLSLADPRQHQSVSRSVSAPTPAPTDNSQYNDHLPPPPPPLVAPRRNEDSSSYLNYPGRVAPLLYVDHEPRSRKPLIDLSPSQQEQLGAYPTVGAVDADRFWAPHLIRLKQQQQQHQLFNTSGHTHQPDSVPPDSLTDSERTIKTPNRDSAIVSNLSTPLPHNCDSQSVSSTGKSSPSSSLSSKDSGCSESSSPQEELSLHTLRDCAEAVIVSHGKNGTPEVGTAPSSPASSPDGSSLPGFSTQKRRSHFRAAMVELETVYQQIAQDEDLLDRAERRDLPTPHQELIWRGRQEEEASSRDTSTEMAFSDIDNILNWNTSSSFENLGSYSRPRTPAKRARGDKEADDMAARMKAAANKIPTTVASTVGLTDQSYLLLSPLEDTYILDKSLVRPEERSVEAILGQEDEPDVRTDDVMFRSVRDARSGTLSDPQPKFGIPLGPVVGGVSSDYLHAVPADRYRSTFHPMRNPDLVKDDLAFRFLRRDDQLGSDPSRLGIVNDPHGVIVPQRVWRPQAANQPPSPARFTSYIAPASAGNGVLSVIADGDGKPSSTGSGFSLASGLARVIRKQSAKPSAQLNDLISYRDLRDAAGYDCMRYSLDTVLLRRAESVGQLAAGEEACRRRKVSSATARGAVSKRGHHRRPRPKSTPALGRTVYEILRHGGGSGGGSGGEGSSDEESAASGHEEEDGRRHGSGGAVDEGEDYKISQNDALNAAAVEAAGHLGRQLPQQQHQMSSQLPEVVTDSLSSVAAVAAAAAIGQVDDVNKVGPQQQQLSESDLGPRHQQQLAGVVNSGSAVGTQASHYSAPAGLPDVRNEGHTPTAPGHNADHQPTSCHNGGHTPSRGHKHDPDEDRKGPTADRRDLVVQTILLPGPRTITSIIEAESGLFPWEQDSKGRGAGQDPWEERGQQPWVRKRHERQAEQALGEDRTAPKVLWSEKNIEKDGTWKGLTLELGEDPASPEAGGKDGHGPAPREGKEPDPSARDENPREKREQNPRQERQDGRKESLVDQAAHVLGLSEDKEASGEVLGWLAHPATLAVSYLLAVLHSLTGVDLLTALGLLLLIVCLLCLLTK